MPDSSWSAMQRDMPEVLVFGFQHSSPAGTAFLQVVDQIKTVPLALVTVGYKSLIEQNVAELHS